MTVADNKTDINTGCISENIHNFLGGSTKPAISGNPPYCIDGFFLRVKPAGTEGQFTLRDITARHCDKMRIFAVYIGLWIYRKGNSPVCRRRNSFPQEESPGSAGRSPSETEVIREGKQTAEENNRLSSWGGKGEKVGQEPTGRMVTCVPCSETLKVRVNRRLRAVRPKLGCAGG